MRIWHVNNKAIAGYMLWHGLEPTSNNILNTYVKLRKCVDLPAVVPLQKKRIASVQSAMCNESFQVVIALLKLVNAPESPTSGESPSASSVQTPPGAPERPLPAD